MANEKPDVVDAANQVIVLAFDLVDTEIPRLPGQLADALKSPPVIQAIEKTLLDFARSKSGPGGAVLTPTDGQKLLEALGTGGKDAASSNLLEQIKKMPEYKKLEAGIEAFKKAAGSSSLGVWVDRNKNVLYVVGAALVVGGASVLYVTKTGGTLLNTALDPLMGKDFEVLQIGTLKIKAGLWDFKPDARILGVRISGTKEWQKVTLNFKLGILAKGADVQQVQGTAVVKSGPFSVSLTADGKPQQHQVDLGLKLGYDAGKFNVGVGAMYKVGPQQSGGVQYGGLLTLTIPL